MPADWSLDDLVTSWTLVGSDQSLLGNKTGATRLGFALMLKFFEREARFPSGSSEFAPETVSFVARQVGVPASDLGGYVWDGRTSSDHRVQIRNSFGFRICTRADELALIGWLTDEACPGDQRTATLVTALLGRCRSLRIEPPGRTDRIVGSARNTFEKMFCEQTIGRLNPVCIGSLEALVVDASETGLLADLKSDPGQLGLETLLREITKLGMVRALNLPAGVFAGVSTRTIESWRARAARAYPSDLLSSTQPVRITLISVLCATRETEITDALVDLLIGLVHKINTHADRRVERELIADLRRVKGKEAILFRVAEVAVERPDDTIRAALYPVVDERTLQDLVREARAQDRLFNDRVAVVVFVSLSAYAASFTRCAYVPL